MRRFFSFLPRTATAPFCPSEVKGSLSVSDKLPFFKKAMLFLGPAFLVSVGYMDPGNWEMNIQAGSRYGVKLGFVLIFASFSAMFIQYMTAKIGIVTGKTLAENIRIEFSKQANVFFWILGECALIATDMAEVLGCAIAFSLLFHLPLLWGIALTALDTMVILGLKGRGFRTIEAIVLSLIVLIFVCLGANLFFIRPPLGELAYQMWNSHPFSLGPNALWIALGMIGATIMPHNLYLHSSLVQTRVLTHTSSPVRKTLLFASIDTILALSLALVVNMSLLIFAASAFYGKSPLSVESLQEAHRLLAPLLGQTWAPFLFALGLLAASQSSTITGTITAQILLEGHMSFKIPCYLRRFITRGCALIPAFLGIYFLGDHAVSQLLVMSQVSLGLLLPFLLWPVCYFTSSKKVLGLFHNRVLSSFLLWMLFLLMSFCGLLVLISFF